MTYIINDDFNYKEKPQNDNYVLKGGNILSPILYLYDENKKIATVSVADYDCKYVKNLNESYLMQGMNYEEKFEWIDNICYTYLLDEDGKVVPIVRGQLDVGTTCLYPIIELEDSLSENEVIKIIKGISWSCDDNDPR